MTFVTLECVRARVWLLPSLRSVGECVWPWLLPERVVVVHIPCVLTYICPGNLKSAASSAAPNPKRLFLIRPARPGLAPSPTRPGAAKKAK